MLSKIFGSKTRVKILKLFLINPEEKRYIRQLARDLKLQLNSVRRELDNLAEFGLLVSENGDEGEAGDKKKKKKNNQEKKYYRANTGFVIFEEIKSLFIKAQILYGNDFISKLKKSGNIKLLILSGIFVNKKDSPVDLFIVGRVNKLKLLKLIKELERELGGEINFSLMESREFDYRRKITDMFLYNILEGDKIVAVNEVNLH